MATSQSFSTATSPSAGPTPTSNANVPSAVSPTTSATAADGHTEDAESGADADKDENIAAWVKEIRASMQAELDARGVGHPWAYPNYAARDQDPFEALQRLDLGLSEFLNRVRRKYDPSDRWRALVPGIWHV